MDLIAEAEHVRRQQWLLVPVFSARQVQFLLAKPITPERLALQSGTALFEPPGTVTQLSHFGTAKSWFGVSAPITMPELSGFLLF